MPYSHGYYYIIGTAVNDHVSTYTAKGGANWGTVGNDAHWASGHNGDHTSKPGDPTRPTPYITANDSWTGGTYDHDDYAFNFLLPRLQAGHYRNQIKFFNCSYQQWSANNGWKSKQDSSGDNHLHISFYGTGMFRFYGTKEYFEWKADGRPNPRTWKSGPPEANELRSTVAACTLSSGHDVAAYLGTDYRIYVSVDGAREKLVDTALVRFDPGLTLCSTDVGNGVIVSAVDSHSNVFAIHVLDVLATTLKATATAIAAPTKAEGAPGVAKTADGHFRMTLIGTNTTHHAFRAIGTLVNGTLTWSGFTAGEGRGAV